MPKFTETEKYVLSLFKPKTAFSFEGKNFTVIEAAKPRPSSGECKTDVYVKICDEEGECRELKISVKQENADFLENKIKYERARDIFGNNVDSILRQSIYSLKKKFEKQYLVCFDKYGRTDANTLKLGWKFEILNKPGGELSGQLALDTQQIIDVYSGQNLPADKKNALVNNNIVNGSGVANYIVFLDKSKDYVLKDILKKLIPIDAYVKEHPQIYYACKALNYRIDEDKWDGNRPLAVYVKWRLNEGVIDGELVLDEPLRKGGNDVGENLRKILKESKISNNNFNELKEKLSPNVRYYVKE